MLRTKLFRNKKGLAPTVSTMLMISITVLCMSIVIVFGQNFIDTRSAQMGERLCVEKVFFDDPDIRMYVTNVGYRDLTLEYVIVNERSYSLVGGKVTLYEDDGQFVTIGNYTVNADGVYRIKFISSRNKELGHTEAAYP